MLSIRLQRLRPGARLCLKHKLYMRNGEMQWWYDSAVEDPHAMDAVLAIAFWDDMPVGAVMVKDGYDVNIYIKYAYRRRGIGSKLLKHIARYRALSVDKLKAGLGAKGSKSFWKQNNVELFSWYKPYKPPVFKLTQDKADSSAPQPYVAPPAPSALRSAGVVWYDCWPFEPGVYKPEH